MTARGVLMYAVNNSHIDYIRIATTNAKCIQAHMNVPVTLVTDIKGSTHELLQDQTIFDRVIVENSSCSKANPRVYRDTIYHSVQLDFKNMDRPSAYDVSPYDETLLIDVDYIIQNDYLNHVWGSVEDIMINRDAISPMCEPLVGNEYRLNVFGIRMYWATVVYFKKTNRANTLFNLIKHIRDNWDYYRLVYNFPSQMYRNDYAFSIAIHTLNGFVDDQSIKALPSPTILSLTDRDQIYSVRTDGSWLLFVNDVKPNQQSKFYAVSVKGLNIHCMNKLSLLRHLEDIEAAL